MINKVVIWGIGGDYQALYNLIKFEELKGNIQIVAMIDKNKWQKKVDGYPVIFLHEITEVEYDFIIVTSSKYYDEIVKEALLVGIGRDRLIPGHVFQIPCFDFGEYVALKRNPISIISDNCWGGKVYHFLGLRMDSPFINFYMDSNDFVHMLDNFSWYMSQPLNMEQEGSTLEIPVGSLGEEGDKVYLYFNHAYSFEEARLDFERRLRINMDNLFIKMQWVHGKTSEKLLHIYDNMPYKKKILLAPFFTDYKSAVSPNFFLKEYSRKNMEKKYHLVPTNYIEFSQRISLFARQYNLLHMLLTGEIIERNI